MHSVHDMRNDAQRCVEAVVGLETIINNNTIRPIDRKSRGRAMIFRDQQVARALGSIWMIEI